MSSNRPPVSPQIMFVLAACGLAQSVAFAQTTWQQKSKIDLARAEYGVDGTLVSIGQIEPGTARSTHEALDGAVPRSKITFTNSTRDVNEINDRDHATRVAGILAGNKPGGFQGTAPGALLQVANWQPTVAPTTTADFLTISNDFLNKMKWFMLQPSTQIINMSTEISPNQGGDTPELRAVRERLRFEHQRIADWTVTQGQLFVGVAGNQGRLGDDSVTAPGTGYNVLTVGATGNKAVFGGDAVRSWDKVATYSGRGSVADRPETGGGPRRKPDLVAPGSNLQTSRSLSDTAYASSDPMSQQGTSFAAPQVAGTAALMNEYGQLNRLSRDPRVMRAAIMNSTNKTVQADSGKRWDELMETDGFGRGAVNMSDQLGTGRLDARAAMRQYVPGQAGPTFGNGGNAQREVPTTAWDLGTARGVGEPSANSYRIREDLRKGSYLTATLSWNRDVVVGGDGTSPGSYLYQNLNDLDLGVSRLGSVGTMLQRANSANTTNEHLVFRVPERAQYYVNAWQAAHNSTVGDSETYGLAWRAFAAPTACHSFNGAFAPDMGAPVDNGWYQTGGSPHIVAPFITNPEADIPDSAYALRIAAGDAMTQELKAPRGYFDLALSYAFDVAAGTSFKVLMPVTNDGVTNLVNLLEFDDQPGDTIAANAFSSRNFQLYVGHVDLTAPAFRGLANVSFTELTFGGVAGGNAYIDNVYYVPTPGPLALLGFAGWAAARRRRSA